MKRVLLLLPLLFIAGCGGYGSQREAKTACTVWSLKEGGFQKGGFIDTASTLSIRSCIHDAATRQVLGYRYANAEEGTLYIGDGSGSFTNDYGRLLEPAVVAKRFRY